MSLGFKKNWPGHVGGFNRQGMPTGSDAGEWVVPGVPKADDEENAVDPEVEPAMYRPSGRETMVGEGVGYDPDAMPGKKKPSGE
jgi:hypothetical protein